MVLKGKHIIIIEDNVMNRVVYQLVLGMAGAVVDFDRWGYDALRQLYLHPKCDLIVLDLMLHGGLDGFEVFKKIRTLPQYDRIPIVAISASEPSLVIPKAKQLGFDGFISKPIDEALIVNQLSAIIKGEKIWYDGTLVRR